MTQYSGHNDDVEMCNTENGISTIYSGTKFNSKCLYEIYDNLAFFCLIDLPLSIITDTVILPYTIYSEVADSGYCENITSIDNK